MKRMVTWRGLTLVGLLPLGCSSTPAAAPSDAGATSSSDASAPGDAGSGGAQAFVGSWSCTATGPLVVTAPPSLVGTYTSSSNGYTLAIVANADGTLTITDRASNDAGLPCVKQATVSGATATFTGQTCPLVAGGQTVTETYTLGTMTVNGSALTESGNSTVAGTITVDGGAESLVGSIAFDGSCTKS